MSGIKKCVFVCGGDRARISSANNYIIFLSSRLFEKVKLFHRKGFLAKEANIKTKLAFCSPLPFSPLALSFPLFFFLRLCQWLSNLLGAKKPAFLPLFTRMAANFVRMATCIFIITTDLLEVPEVWMTELPPPLSFCNSCISTSQEQTRYLVEQVWGYSCDTFEL